MAPSSFSEVLHRETTMLQARFPELAESLSRAHAILAEGRLFVEESGREAMVLASDGATYYHVNGSCACKASAYRQEPCKHRLALRLYQRGSDAVLADEEERSTVVADSLTPPTVPAEHLLVIQGKPFVRFEGLLQLAHARGLLELTTTLVQCSLDMAVCQCVARFGDGRIFTDIGDASPENVAKHLRPHFVRMAATRASARALRRATAPLSDTVEELGEEVGP
jgi:hypothetical protein